MLLGKVKKQGLMLDDDELRELVEMYKTGIYYLKDLAEEFGINQYELKCYLKIAKWKGIL